MTAKELIEELQRLTPEQQQLTVIGHDQCDAVGTPIGIALAALENADNLTTRPCVYLIVEEIETLEWVTPHPNELVKDLKDSRLERRSATRS